MRCDELREQMISLVYDEKNDSPDTLEMREHLRTCPACREEIDKLRRTSKYLHLWKDEPPLRSIAIAKCETAARKSIGRRSIRYAAIAAMAVICFLALANIQVVYTDNEIRFSTHLFPRQEQEGERNYYTKAELRNLMKDALDYTNETNYIMMQKMMDTIEQDRWRDIGYIRDQAAKNRN